MDITRSLLHPTFQREHDVTIDLSNLDFISLFDIVSFFTTIIGRGTNLERLAIDVVGRTDLLPVADLAALERQGVVAARVADSRRAYRIAGFLESLGARAVLQRWLPGASVHYLKMSDAQAAARRFYSNREDDHSVLNELYSVSTHADAKRFLRQDHVETWRKAMAERFLDSPLFQLDELWRVFCHELAANVCDHSGSAGLIATRVFETGGANLHAWCRWSFDSALHPVLSASEAGVLELTIADSGLGFAHNLQTVLAQRQPAHADIIDVLGMAFDELGSSRKQGFGALLKRHALNRLLRLAVYYGGCVTLRSDGYEVIYVGWKPLVRRSRNLGYVPHEATALPTIVPGAQLQVILPLYPPTAVLDAVPATRKTLPTSFAIDHRHPIGHLVPVGERLGYGPASTLIDQESFVSRASSLPVELLTSRPSEEPVVLDFSELNWTPQQLETFLYLFQNVLQTRLALAVEMPISLARAVRRLEDSASASTLAESIRGEIPEKMFLDTYRLFSSGLLTIDSAGRRYLLGSGGSRMEQGLLELIDHELSPQEVARRCVERVSVAEVERLLRRNEYLFAYRADRWFCHWDPEMLAAQTRRVVTRHFDKIAERSRAWRGGGPYAGATSRRVFYFPWDDSWLLDFFESSTILARERYADDIAQRLVARLGRRLAAAGSQTVGAFVCVTAPSLLLASAMHRWWTLGTRPAIIDLGEHMLLSRPLPVVATDAQALIVQDVLDTGKVTLGLLDALRRQRLVIGGVVSFVRMIRGATRSRATDESEWSAVPGADIEAHSLFEVPRPQEAPLAERDESSPEAFWVEPRALRPYRFRALRQEFKDKDSELAGRARFFTRGDYLESFDSADETLLSTGHFVYGRRHYVVNVDMRRLLEGEAGNTIVEWVSDVCEGTSTRQRASWETEDGYGMKGDVTAIVMPLHSRIGYVLPMLQRALARRNRRVPFWLLDATLFVGDGATYRLPKQFRQQIVQAAAAMATASSQADFDGARLRLFIIDDAISTGRTCETILATIHEAVDDAIPQKARGRATSPVEWIRYFAIMNQMSPAINKYWHNIREVGHPPARFAFEEFAPLIGLRSYDDDTCPACQARARVEHLQDAARARAGHAFREWAKKERVRLAPRLLENRSSQSKQPPALAGPFVLVTGRSRPAWHTAAVILEFERLMSLSFPVQPLIEVVEEQAWNLDLADEYERIRWWVLDWCLRHLGQQTVVGNSARAVLFASIEREITEGTAIVPRLFLRASVHWRDPDVKQLILSAFDKLIVAERQTASGEPDILARVDLLETAVDAFLLGASHDAMTNDDEEELAALLDALALRLSAADEDRQSFARNVYLRYLRPARHASPEWALLVIAEALYRGRDETEPIDGNHLLLPRLLSDLLKRGVRIPELRHLLRESLALFSSALDELVPYAPRELAGDVPRLCSSLLEWLGRAGDDGDDDETPNALRHLFDHLQFDSRFIKTFNSLFHERVEVLLDLHGSPRGQPGAEVKLTVDVPPDIRKDRMLTEVQRLRSALVNWCVQPGHRAQASQTYESSIRVARLVDKPRIQLRLLTSFAEAEATQLRIDQSPHSYADRTYLERFGVSVGRWELPTDEERASGAFLAALTMTIPVGFGARRF